MAKLVSKVYGDALFEVAVESGRLDEIWEQTRAMQTALEENPELFALMRHPKIVKEEKVKIIESIFTGEVCAELVGLLRMIVERIILHRSGRFWRILMIRSKNIRVSGLLM